MPVLQSDSELEESLVAVSAVESSILTGVVVVAASIFAEDSARRAFFALARASFLSSFYDCKQHEVNSETASQGRCDFLTSLASFSSFYESGHVPC